MSKVACALYALGLWCVFLVSPCWTSATTIEFTATDLDDTLGPGGDLWEYRYRVSDRVFAHDTGFSIAFAPDLYRDLLASSVHTAWDVLTFQPDPGLPNDGFYDALAWSMRSPWRIPFVSVSSGWAAVVPRLAPNRLASITLMT